MIAVHLINPLKSPKISCMQEFIRFVKAYLYHILLAVGLYSLCRLLFWFSYADTFGAISFSVLLGGLRFDMSAIALLFALFTWLWFLPFAPLQRKAYRVVVYTAFSLGVCLSLFLNLIDVIYFDFTHKRTTADVLHILFEGNDSSSLLLRFAGDYWYMVLLFLFLSGASIFVSVRFIGIPVSKGMQYTRFFALLFSTSLLLIAFRGGWQYKPITLVNAATYAQAKHIPLVLNTPFSFFKTLFESRITPLVYFSDEEAEDLFQKDQIFHSERDFDAKNIVLIVLESFSKEYIGFYNQGKGFTPFLDSLLAHSTVYANCVANGKQSIEGIPAICASLPSLIDDSYITSPYGGNRINSIASVLKEKGYISAFFHGGQNGTMSFDAFAGAAGYTYYFGKNEYPYKGHDDGHWGIYDEPYLKYVAEKLSEFSSPFHALVFTLSSHHPFRIPDKYKNVFPKGYYEIHESIGYADHALRGFFAHAAKQDWFKNTLFVLTADHTSMSSHPFYSNAFGDYTIPLAIYNPSHPVHEVFSGITQQTDIMPNLLDKIQYNGKITSFGNFPADKTENRFAVNYAQGIYQLANDTFLLQFNGENTLSLYRYKTDSLLQHNVLHTEAATADKLEKKLKAYIQVYQQALINNRLTPEP